MSTLYDIDAFFKGYKPSLLHNPNSTFFTYTDEEMEQLSKYPYMPIVVHELDQHLYFQSDEIKEKFKNDIANIKVDSLKYHNKIGLALGFPPKAAYFYCRCMQDNTLDLYKVSIDYCGISCVGALEDIRENVEWFWQLPIGDETFKGINIGYNQSNPSVKYLIQYGDVDSLQIAIDELQWLVEKRKRALTSSAL